MIDNEVSIMAKHYTHEDMKRELFLNPKVKKAHEKELRRLMISHQIIELREQHRMSQKQLAERLHTKQQVISRIEKDNYRPSLSTLEKIADLFGKKLEIRFV